MGYSLVSETDRASIVVAEAIQRVTTMGKSPRSLDSLRQLQELLGKGQIIPSWAYVQTQRILSAIGL